jgi:hypothetical protein
MRGLKRGVGCSSFFSRKTRLGDNFDVFQMPNPTSPILADRVAGSIGPGCVKELSPSSPVPTPCYICGNTHIFSQSIPFILSLATFSLYMHVELNQYPLSVVLLSKILD